MKTYPSITEIRELLKNNLTKSIRVKVLKAFIIGSEAKGISNEKSDLDIAVVIPELKRKTSIQFSENYHSYYKLESQKPKWKERIIDFQFFYETDKDLKNIKKIPV
jgi:predicted nucleotidyltransferase